MVPRPDQSVQGNGMLAALPDLVRASLARACDTVALVSGQVLGVPRGRMTHAYFPTSAVISLSVGTAGQGDNLEVALVGREGMFGLPLLLGGATSEAGAIVTTAGAALRIGAAALRSEIAASPPLAQRLHRYLLVMLAQTAQLAVCTRHHRLDQRLARWLLMAEDRVRPAGLHATHEALATRLGVRRAGITRAATTLQAAQLITYRRGEMKLLDREGLEAVACICYATDASSYRRLMRPKG